ncbi:MAG TPA: CaiB/BaiF CoA-transferase family protein [Ramlibacter sp.]|nr:CaiB/BaiF CoA-transferase family protein [Ramlibacter sp.]
MTTTSPSIDERLPLSGVRVVEFTHMVMGPTCGMILADLGAEVIKVEPPGGDKTRRLPGLGMGFFRTYNRNKKSVVLDIDSPEGREAALRLIGEADVMIENFRPGRMASLGLGYATLAARFPRLIYASHKGFLPGPYENRAALDEVVQMMAGLAYMTGPVGRPMRAGAPVNDMMGGMFGVIGIQAALIERAHTGRGQEVQSSLYENCVWLCSPHMQQFAMSGEAPPPLAQRVSAWSVYDVFTLAGDAQLFIAATSDRHWQILCEILGQPQWAADPALQTNRQRVELRPRLLPQLAEVLKQRDLNDMIAQLDAAGLPYAPIRRPHELFDDPHLNESGGLTELSLGNGDSTRMPLLPLMLGGRRPGVHGSIPQVGDSTQAVLQELGYSEEQIARLGAPVRA